MAPLLGEGLPRRSDSYEEKRQGCTMHQQKPQEFESQPDPVLNNVIVLKVWSKFNKKYLKFCMNYRVKFYMNCRVKFYMNCRV